MGLLFSVTVFQNKKIISKYLSAYIYLYLIVFIYFFIYNNYFLNINVFWVDLFKYNNSFWNYVLILNNNNKSFVFFFVILFFYYIFFKNKINSFSVFIFSLLVVIYYTIFLKIYNLNFFVSNIVKINLNLINGFNFNTPYMYIFSLCFFFII